MTYGLIAYVMWGLFPAFFPLLLPAGPLEILAHRILWAAIIMAIVLFFTKGWRELRDAGPKTWLQLVLSGALITANWGIYVVAVNSGHVADAALGYFINPLFSVLLGVLFLGERLRKFQVGAVSIAAVGVVWLLFFAEQAPIMALGLTLSFGLYGLAKKRISLSPTTSLAGETIAMMPLALIYLTWLEGSGQGTFFTEGASHSLLLIVSGVVTVLPLLFYGKAAKLLPLTTIGMLQYVTPTMQMLWALFVTNEQLSASRWTGFIIIWIAVALYLWDIVRWQKERKSVRHTE
ncbi:EamA family transporter RarD [Corynebacterium lubricantis]|uniref:EamA family transporter RarD n=1 Tax=Corynebacterium lubricantis TaxID=541095 RepID=UPI0003750EF9|nr:EamA family transporter RarD [Corynebacterium lubricantis]